MARFFRGWGAADEPINTDPSAGAYPDEDEAYVDDTDILSHTTAAFADDDLGLAGPSRSTGRTIRKGDPTPTSRPSRSALPSTAGAKRPRDLRHNAADATNATNANVRSRPGSQRSSAGRGATLDASTLDAAAISIEKALRHQIEEAGAQSIEANAPFGGDAAVRTWFYSLLPDVLQRQVYLRVMSDAAAWPRARSLFGAPPYSFLKPEDGAMLAAKGFAMSRVNMTYDGTWSLGYAQFGTAHFTDAVGRQYKVAQAATNGDSRVGPAYMYDAADGSGIVMALRLPRRSFTERQALLRDDHRSLSFPVLNDRLLLSPNPALWAMVGGSEPLPASVTVDVSGVHCADRAASVCLVRVHRV